MVDKAKVETRGALVVVVAPTVCAGLLLKVGCTQPSLHATNLSRLYVARMPASPACQGPLVTQFAGYAERAKLTVTAYCGAGSLTRAEWERQLAAARSGEHVVVVCTPQLLLNRLEAGNAALNGCVDLLVSRLGPSVLQAHPCLHTARAYQAMGNVLPLSSCQGPLG